MENKKPEFAFQEHSVISLVTEMHNYFKDLQSFYQISKGELLSKIEAENNEKKVKELQIKLKEINQKMDYFRVLSHAVSIADTVLHNEIMIEEFCKKDEKNA
jgi:hypothetical protein